LSRKFETILAAHGISYRASGRDEILVRCPQCGSADPSQHMAVNTNGRGYRCLRNPTQHKGKIYSRLLALVLNCSLERAKELLGEKQTLPLPSRDEFASSWRKQLGLVGPEGPTTPKKLQFPKEIKPLVWGSPRSTAFWNYLLQERGFTRAQAEWASEAYDFHYTVWGKYSYRIVIPIYNGTGELMTWTARAIDPRADIRYMTHPKGEAVAPPTSLLLGLPILSKTRLTRYLVVCEGPFDAIAVSVLGHSLGIWGTCLFGLELSEIQADLLSDLADRFDRVGLLLDPEQAWLRTLDMTSLLPRRCKMLHLPEGFKDPGECVKSKEGAQYIASLAA
jgi:hypothetical protein